MKDDALHFERFVELYLKLDHGSRTSFNQPVFHKMLNRMTAGQTAVLPFRTGDQVLWMVLQADEHLLVAHTQEIRQFIKPLCEPLPLDRGYFTTGRSDFGDVGATVLPNGYYRFRSKAFNEGLIWERLHLWIQLDRRRPEIREMETEISAFTLRNSFQRYIATQQWELADSVLETIRQGRYVSDENYLFLKFQWMYGQRLWDRMYFSKEYEFVAHLEYVPAKIQEALLSAFYYAVLSEAEAENHLELAIDKYTQERYRMLPILHRFVQSDHVLYRRLSAYEAFAAGNRSRLAQLAAGAEDEIVRNLYERAAVEFGEEEDSGRSETESDPENLVRQYVLERRYDDAFRLLPQCDNRKEAVKWAAKIACMTDSAETYHYALQLWSDLPEETRIDLLSDPESKSDLLLVQAYHPAPSHPAAALPERMTWNAWFQLLLSEYVTAETLEEGLRAIELPQGGMIWTDSALAQLSDMLVEVATAFLGTAQRNLLQTALPMLVSELSTHERFPDHRGSDVYRYLLELMGIVLKRNPTSTGLWLNLAEGLLCLDAHAVNTLWKMANQWFHVEPNNRSKMMLPSFLSALELFYDYNAPQEELNQEWMKWTGAIGNALQTIDRLTLDLWLEMGRLLQVSEDFLQQYAGAVAEEEKRDLLAVGGSWRIAIFTLRVATAERAMKRIVTRNPNLKVVIVADETLTNEAKVHARNADVAVIVTSCLSHALFYGIQKYVKNKTVYPRSSGSTGIIQAIEDYFSEHAS